MQLPDIKTILFHKDFDGFMSAIMLKKLFPNAQLKAIDYPDQEAFREMPIDESYAIVDFMFHPNAGLWIDHHDTTHKLFAKPTTYNHFQIFDNRAPSCPYLLNKQSWFSKEFLHNFRYFVDFADIIDSARWHYPEQSVQTEYLAVAINCIIPQILNNPVLTEAFATTLLKELEMPWTGSDGLTDTIALIKKPLEHFKLDLEKAIKGTEHCFLHHIAFKDPLVQVPTGVCLVDQTNTENFYYRYLPYSFYDSMYESTCNYALSIRNEVHNKQTVYRISLGANPFKEIAPDEILNLVEFAQNFGGGGRTTAVGIPVPTGTTKEQAFIIFRQVADALRTYIVTNEKLPESKAWRRKTA